MFEILDKIIYFTRIDRIRLIVVIFWGANLTMIDGGEKQNRKV